MGYCMNVQPFTPGATNSLAATTTSTSVAIPLGGVVIRVVNAGTGTAFVRWGTGTVTAVVTDMPILPSSYEVFTCGTATSFAAICATGTATLYITAGEGQ